jgi:hypothetical protein
MDTIFSDRSAFRLKSPLITSNGAPSDTHPQITATFAELNKLLSKRVFTTEGWEGSDSFDWRKAEERADAARATAAAAERTSDVESHRDPLSDEAVTAEKRSASAAKAAAKAEERAAKALEQAAVAPEDDAIDVGRFLLLRLKPRRAGGDEDAWQKWSLADVLSDHQSSPAYATLSEVIDLYPPLSELYAELLGVLHEKRFKLPDATRTVLSDDYLAIRDYLVLFGASQPGIDDVDGLANFIFYASRGAARIADYAIISAARDIVKRKALSVPDYNDDEGQFVADIRSAAQAGQLPMSQTAFDRGVLRVANRQIFGVTERELFARANVGELPQALQEQIIQRMGTWAGTITEDNVDIVVNSLLAQIQGPDGEDAEETEAPEASPEDFRVTFFEDSVDDVLISRSSVLCAAQLFHAVVAGDELDVFGAVDYFTHRYLLRGGIEIRDPRLRADLQRYVFSNRFTDSETGIESERTRAPERQMFARQVFAMGNSQVTDDMIVNAEFPRLWKVLMLESAKYLEYARESFNADAYVSRQGVMQAVEDLQYNLSTHCTGMVTVLTPLIDAELQFVVRRILMHAEIRRQVVPAGGSWKRVVERLNMEGKHRSANATVLYNKAKLGQMIIEAVSDYDPAEFETDGPFSSFISTVDRFITTQSILQDELQREGPPDEQPEEPGGYAPPSMMPGGAGMPAPAPAASANANGAAHNGAAADEWDF